MPLVKAIPKGLQNGNIITEFTDTTNLSAVTYTYPTQQTSLVIENSGEKDIFVTVGSYTDQLIQADKKWKVDTPFTSFSIKSNVNSQEFIATASFDSEEDLASLTAQLADISINVKSFGAKGDWNGTTGTDDTASIQSALESFLGNRIIFPSGTYVTSGNDVPSDKTLEFLPGAKLYLKDGSNRPALQNKNWKLNVDKNITIIDLELLGNDDNQLHHTTTGEYANEYLSGIRFFGVTNLKLINPTIRRAKTFAIWCANIKSLIVHNPTFDQKMTGAPGNQDGLHLNGPITNADIRNVRGSTNDDMVALNADDGALGATVTSGAITNVVIDGVYGEGCLNGIRLLSATSRIDQIGIKNVMGSYRDPAINLSSYGLGAGNFGSISIDTVDADCNGAYAGADYYGVIVLNNNIENISIRNIHRNKAKDNRPSVLVLRLANIGNLEIDGLQTFSTTGAPSLEQNIRVQGLVNRMILSNINYFRDSLLPQEGSVLWVDGYDSTSYGINSLIVNNLIVNRCSNVISVTKGFLSNITMTNVNDIDSLPGLSLLNLEVSGKTTKVKTSACTTDSSRYIVKTSNGATVTGIANNGAESGSSAFVTNDQLLTALSYNLVKFDSLHYSRIQNELSLTNYNFTNKNAAGIYQVDITLALKIPNPSTSVVVALYRNAQVSRYLFSNTYSSDTNLSVSTSIPLEINETLDIRVYVDKAATISLGQLNSIVTYERIK